jgi:DNA-binding beta-propeller fold protein YncE
VDGLRERARLGTATRWAIALLGIAVGARAAPAQTSFVNFESGHVRPLAPAPGGERLFAVNTPDNRLAIYDVVPAGLVLAAEVPVGLEPVAVAARTTSAGRLEAWVVNHLSDSVSIVEIDPQDATLSRVVRTLLVGDEPRDIVFAGASRDRAFITCARRGQNHFPGAEATGPQLATPGVGRADVWVFAAESPGAALGGTPSSIVQLFGDEPRALAVSPDGALVYAAIFNSGNRTTTINESARAALAELPPPPAGGRLDGPSTGLIVKWNPDLGRWEDELGRDWNDGVRFTLPDHDVFAIDANANPPALRSGANTVSGVGTALFNMAVHPTNGRLYVSNTEARNHVRFVGLFGEDQGVTGHLVENRVTIVDGTVVMPVHLNPHIDYTVAPGPPAEIAQSLALPMDMTFSSDGATVFVVAFGSDTLAALATQDLEAGAVAASRLTVGRGPSGVVLDPARDRLYVLNAIDRTISIVADAASPSRAVTGTVALPFDPSPAAVTGGRAFLYDARLSAHGDAACASCHVFGDFDGLAWDLGDPFGTDLPDPNPFHGAPPAHTSFHPMKGPMMTQSLRGLAGAGPMHWRGDRTGGNDPGGDPLSEEN